MINKETQLTFEQIQEAIDSIQRFYDEVKENSILSFHWALTGMIGEFYVAQTLLDFFPDISLKQKRHSFDLLANNKRFEVKTTKKNEQEEEIGFDWIKPENFDVLVLVYLNSDLAVRKMKWFSTEQVRKMFLPRAIAWKAVQKIREEDLVDNLWIAYQQNSDNEKWKTKIKEVDNKFQLTGKSFLQRYEELVNILQINVDFNPDLDYLID